MPKKLPYMDKDLDDFLGDLRWRAYFLMLTRNFSGLNRFAPWRLATLLEQVVFADVDAEITAEQLLWTLRCDKSTLPDFVKRYDQAFVKCRTYAELAEHMLEVLSEAYVALENWLRNWLPLTFYKQ